MSRITFLTKRDCALCAAGLALVEPHIRRRGHQLVIEDGSLVPWADEYAERLPVVLRDGAVVLEGRFTQREAKRALR